MFQRCFKHSFVGDMFVFLLSSLACVILFLTKAVNCSSSGSSDLNSNRLLLLISYDGLRYDFITQDKTPFLYELAQKGVWGKDGILPTVLTVTAPNHHSIVTGLYQESHGIIGNTFYDPVYKQKYDIWNFGNDSEVAENSLHEKWYSNEPIWITNQKAGNFKSRDAHGASSPRPRCSGSQFWPQGNANYSMGPAPCFVNVWKDYGNLTVWKSEVDEIIDWFTHPERPINFAMYYNGQPDHIQHSASVFSANVSETIRDLDKLTEYLVQRCKEKGIWDQLNIILTADHGHLDVQGDNLSNIVLLDDLVPGLFQHHWDDFIWSEHSMFVKNTSRTREVYEALCAAIEKARTPLKVYLKQDFPDEFHYKNNRRVGDIIFVPQPGAYFFYNRTLEQIFKRKGGNHVFGGHGFLNKVKEMRPFFIATGPVFKQNFQFNYLVENIDLYPLMCVILGIPSLPNNGSFLRIKDILREQFLADNWPASSGHGFGLLWTSENRVALVIVFSIVVPTVLFSFFLFTCCLTRPSSRNRRRYHYRNKNQRYLPENNGSSLHESCDLLLVSSSNDPANNSNDIVTTQGQNNSPMKPNNSASAASRGGRLLDRKFSSEDEL